MLQSIFGAAQQKVLNSNHSTEQYIAESGNFESRLKRHTEEHKQHLKTIRENLSENYISKNKYTEDSEDHKKNSALLKSGLTKKNLVRLSETLKEYTVSVNNNNTIGFQGLKTASSK